MGETLTRLGIYWPELIAQVINFAIVLLVLWKWAYRPVMAMLEIRREKVAESMANADKIKAELARTEAERREVMQKTAQEAVKIIEDTRVAAARLMEAETQKAVAAANQILAKAKEASEAELARMKAELRKEIGRLVVQTTARVTGKILTLEDQQRLAEETNKQVAA